MTAYLCYDVLHNTFESGNSLQTWWEVEIHSAKKYSSWRVLQSNQLSVLESFPEEMNTILPAQSSLSLFDGANLNHVRMQLTSISKYIWWFLMTLARYLNKLQLLHWQCNIQHRHLQTHCKLRNPMLTATFWPFYMKVSVYLPSTASSLPVNERSLFFFRVESFSLSVDLIYRGNFRTYFSLSLSLRQLGSSIISSHFSRSEVS